MEKSVCSSAASAYIGGEGRKDKEFISLRMNEDVVTGGGGT